MGDQHLWSKCHNNKSKVVNANLSNYPISKVDWIIAKTSILSNLYKTNKGRHPLQKSNEKKQRAHGNN
jgi:hypothetical protein